MPGESDLRFQWAEARMAKLEFEEMRDLVIYALEHVRPQVRLGAVRGALTGGRSHLTLIERCARASLSGILLDLDERKREAQLPDDQQTQQGGQEPWRPSARLEAMWQRDVVGPMDDFQDPSQEPATLAPELLGTFFLVLVACGGGVMGEAFPTRSAAPLPSPRPG